MLEILAGSRRSLEAEAVAPEQGLSPDGLVDRPNEIAFTIFVVGIDVVVVSEPGRRCGLKREAADPDTTPGTQSLGQRQQRW